MLKFSPRRKNFTKFYFSENLTKLTSVFPLSSEKKFVLTILFLPQRVCLVGETVRPKTHRVIGNDPMIENSVEHES